MRIMNAAVVIPPIEDFYFSPRRFASLGALKGAEILTKAGFTTSFFDFTKGPKYKIEIPESIKYLKKYIMQGEKGSCSFFTAYTHFGFGINECASIIAAGNFAAVFVSLFAFCYADSAIAFARSLKRIKPDIKIIACGAGVSVFPEYFKNYFDFVIVGEAEVFLERYRESGLSGLMGLMSLMGNPTSLDFILPASNSLESNLPAINSPACNSAESNLPAINSPACNLAVFNSPACNSAESNLPAINSPASNLAACSAANNLLACYSNNRHTKAGDFLPSVGITYTDKKSICVSIMLSRGCYKKCRFCSNFITHGRGFRNTTPEILKETLENMRAVFENHKGLAPQPFASSLARPCASYSLPVSPVSFGNKKIFINIEDDNILYDSAVFFKQLEIIKEFFIKIGVASDKIFFSAENGLDYMLLDKDICEILINNFNFRQFNFTLTSSDKNVTESQKRLSDINKLEDILFYLDEKRVPAVTYFIAGLDSDSPVKAVESLLFLAKTPGLSGISMFYAVPNLPGFSTDRFGSSFPPELCRGSSAYPWNNTLTTKQLITAFRISRTINFLKKEEHLLHGSEQELRKKILSEKKLFTITADNSIIEPKEIDFEMAEMFFGHY